MQIGKWDESIHTEIEQLKRIATAKKIKASDVVVDYDTQTAQIKGRDGIYDVALDDCSCMDFSVKQRPCKHIYRLAMELNLVNDLPEFNKEAQAEFNKTIPEEIDRFKKLYENGAISLDKLVKIAIALSS